MKCPNCGNITQDDAVFCDQCGARIDKPAEAAPTAPAPVAPTATEPPTPQPSAPAPAAAPQPATAAGSICPSCGASNTPGEMFCAECGTPLEAPQPSPAAAEAPQAPPAPAAPAASPGGNQCPVCGAQLTGDDAFCFACGADLKAQPAAAATPVPEAEPMPATATSAPAAPVAEVIAAEESPTAVEEPAAPAVPEPAAITECPACGAVVQPTDTFCEFCDAALVSGQPVDSGAVPAGAPAQPAAPVAQPQPAPVPAAPVPAATLARLVIPDSGLELPISAQETLVGREDAISGIFPDIDLTPHGGEQGGVSRRHFKITQRGSQFLIEDLNSTNFTMVNRQRLQPGSPLALSDGDEIRAGRVHLVFKVS